jgi:hypothetical protein
MSQPILNTWVVPFPSDARIIELSGESWKLGKNAKEYVELQAGSFLVPGDIVHLKRDSKVIVEFEDHSGLTINPRNYPVEESEEDIYFTIEKKKSSNNAVESDRDTQGPFRSVSLREAALNLQRFS